MTRIRIPIFIRALYPVLSWVIVIRSVAGADLPSPTEVVAEAGKACVAAWDVTSRPRPPADGKEKLERQLRERTWIRLAMARVNCGDFDGACDALDQVNADPRFSQLSVQAMRTEVTGKVADWPDDLTPAIKEKQRQVLADILKNGGHFTAALELIDEIDHEPLGAWMTAQTLLARSRTLEKTDRKAALKDQLEATSLAFSIRDGDKILRVQYEVVRGQVRLGPPDAARVTLQATAQTLKELEPMLPRQAVIQEWLRVGKLYLLVDDNRTAGACFDRARRLYTMAFPDRDWNESVPNQLMMRYRCEALRESKPSESVAELMADWEQAFESLTDSKEIGFVAPYLVADQVRANRFEQLSTLVHALDVPQQGIVVQQAAQQLNNDVTPEQLKAFARIVQTLQAENDQLHLPMLIVAADLYRAANDQMSVDAMIDQSLEISADHEREQHSMIAGWLAENGDYERANDLIHEIDDPVQRAQVLAELAYQMTKPRKAAVNP